MPDSPLADAAGKLWALPYTAAGAAAGTLNVLAARLAGRKDARITLGNNAIQFENGLLGSAEPGAFTLGNSVLYGPGAHPGTKIDTRYDGQPTSVTLLGNHEMGHTYRYADPLFPQRYASSEIVGRINGKPNRYEVEADDFAEEAYRRRK